ncbi:hypothetical protein D3C75_520540 [compost metagenome]
MPGSPIHRGPAGLTVSGVQELPRIGLLELPPGQIDGMGVIFRVLEGEGILDFLVHNHRILG